MPQEHGPEVENRSARFRYNPQSKSERIGAILGTKTSIYTACTEKISYRIELRVCAVAMLLLLEVLLDPQAFPDWVGVSWATTGMPVSRDMFVVPSCGLLHSH